MSDSCASQLDDAEVEARHRGLRNALKALCFAGLAVAALAFLSALLMTNAGMEGDSDEALGGLYALPENSIQVVTVGTSTLQDGISPVRLFEEHGIASFNCATPRQSVIMSHYLIEEALRTQGDSLSAVVIDITPYLASTVKFREECVKFFISNMRWSSSKVRCLRDAAGTFSDLNPIEQAVPVFQYHSRWNELTTEDFAQVFTGKESSLVVGQACVTTSNRAEGRAGVYSPERNSQITDQLEWSDKKLAASIDEEARDYLDKTMELCREHGLDVVFVKSPDSRWGNKKHDRAVFLAQAYGVPLLDFSVPALQEECGLTYDEDFADDRHVNVFGSMKITDYVGNYLAEHYDFGESPESARSVFTDEVVARFRERVAEASLKLGGAAGAGAGTGESAGAGSGEGPGGG